MENFIQVCVFAVLISICVGLVSLCRWRYKEHYEAKLAKIRQTEQENADRGLARWTGQIFGSIERLMTVQYEHENGKFIEKAEKAEDEVRELKWKNKDLENELKLMKKYKDI